jgi:hypothetical protein
MDYIDKDLIEYEPINDENNFINKLNVLLDLPIEFSIIENDLNLTFLNLFQYFKKNNYLIAELPEPFYSDYVMNYSFKSLQIIKTEKLNKEIKDKVLITNPI